MEKGNICILFLNFYEIFSVNLTFAQAWKTIKFVGSFLKFCIYFIKAMLAKLLPDYEPSSV